MKAWLFQDARQKAKLGDACPWAVGYYDPDGKKRQKTFKTRSAAEKYQRKVEGQLEAGTYNGTGRKQWAQFRTEWEQKIGLGMLPQTYALATYALDHFERIMKPKRLAAIGAQTIDEYVAKRKQEPAHKPNKRKAGAAEPKRVAPATINRELRHLRAFLRIAVDWGYIGRAPKFRMLREPERLIRFVTPEDFAKIYAACGAVDRPEGATYTAGDWWRALLVFAYMTGWRISEITALRWDDVSLDNGTAITRAEDNKGKRDGLIHLHPIVVEHLRRIVDFEIRVFSWRRKSNELLPTFREILRHAGVVTPYAFHDFRRAFATANAERLTADALGVLMRHRDHGTTKRYINMARQVNQAAEKLFVPDFLQGGAEN